MNRPGSILRQVVIALAAGLWSCQDTPTSPMASYPTTVNRLSPQDHTLLAVEFRNQYPDLCSDLDDYGFPQISGEVSCNRDRSFSCSGVDWLLVQARSELVAMQRFTGVTAHERLSTRSYHCTPWFLNIRYANQVYDGLEVLRTDLLVHMGQGGMLEMTGHHFANIFIPYPVVKPSQAQKSLIGMNITWYGLGSDRHEYVVDEGSFDGDPHRVVLPHVVGDRIELRVAWAVSIAHASWFVYVDSITGEELEVEQNFFT
jgi:hypothetical protein